jgi:D-alanyl-lipoteichoic acid acyltransferase DltB (MBOAT superfamily)
MSFTTKIFFAFYPIVFVLYWLIRKKTYQNILLLFASYVFYGWIHPWFCILIGVSTLTDYFVGLRLSKAKKYRKFYLAVSLTINLGMLGFFKYFNFFVDSFVDFFDLLGFSLDPINLKVFLPVGISFYTFQTLSYTIDVYRRKMQPRRNFIDFALFVSFFPQLVAGPIERARRFLPQIESPRQWSWRRFNEAWPLLIMGYLSKVVVADNLATYVNQIYMLKQPTFFLLFAATLGFTVQIYADFSAYTNLARGFAKLIGFDLVENFNSPYLALSPSDFWRRWHISFSSWIRDYLYIPLGGSRVKYRWQHFLVIMTSMGLSGLWHGAAWHFVLWGLYNGLLVFTYHLFGIGGRWKPKGIGKTLLAWCVMFVFTVFGWLLFRTSSMAWLVNIIRNSSLGLRGDSLITGVVTLAYVCFFTLPLLIKRFVDALTPRFPIIEPLFYAAALTGITIYIGTVSQDFIYFQF